MAPVLDRRAHPLVRRARHRRRQPAPLRAPAEKLSHYAKRTVDIEYRFGFAGSEWGELEGIANRTDYDLDPARAALGPGPVSYFDQASDERYMPYVIEPAGGPEPLA